MSTATSDFDSGSQSLMKTACDNPKNAGFSICKTGFYGYVINFDANAAFLSLFALSWLGYLVVFLIKRHGLSFTVAMMLGMTCEVLGYAGRVISTSDQFDETGFLMQICTLTIGPAFMAAGIYLCLRKIVYCFGTESSRIPPDWYPRIFIPCDLISLILQATGGGMASVAQHRGTSVTTGDNIMIAGLAFQVFTMLIFIVCAGDFAVRCYLNNREASRRADVSPALKGFLAALAASAVVIFIRCVYRVAELSGGWTGPLEQNQPFSIAFESTMILAATFMLNVFNPLLFRQMMRGQ